jgi:hypothetical protein
VIEHYIDAEREDEERVCRATDDSKRQRKSCYADPDRLFTATDEAV